MKTLYVDLGSRRYPIFMGAELLANPETCLFPYITSRDIVIISNDTVAPLYLNAIKDALAGKYRVETVILDDGERYKTLDSINRIYDHLLEHRFNRDVTLIALGGGVVGDMAGFAAASYQRGVPFIQIPTTLLAQVDSSVGGKTGVNHRLGKNMIGAFHQPQCVIVDIDTLSTLDDRQFSAGLAEVIKYGLIRDLDFLNWIEENLEALLARDPQALIYAIEKSCQNKADIVAADERESGVRATLNLGHTFGHAIETGMGYGEWLHGEAVAVGMAMAAALSERLHWLAENDVQRIVRLLKKASLPVTVPDKMSAARFSELMMLDKKVQDGQLRLVLLTQLGQAVVTADYSADALSATLASFCNE